MNKNDYDAQQAVCNLTIQHTVSDVVDGVPPERVTNIVVEEEEEEGERSSLRIGVSVKAIADVSVKLQYTLTVHDPTYTITMLRAELAQAVQVGTMDEHLRFYAAQFGASSLTNATFGIPRVTGNTADPSDSDSDLADWVIALIVIGGVLALVLIIGGVRWRRSKKSDSAVLPAA